MLDHPFSVALIAACTLVLAAHYARPWLDTLRARRIARADRSRLPGNLREPVYRDDAGHHEWLQSLHEDEWEEAHVNDALTLAGQPSLEAIDCAMWELELAEGSER
jgi:hypothetical protein